MPELPRRTAPPLLLRRTTIQRSKTGVRCGAERPHGASARARTWTIRHGADPRRAAQVGQRLGPAPVQRCGQTAGCGAQVAVQRLLDKRKVCKRDISKYSFAHTKLDDKKPHQLSREVASRGRAASVERGAGSRRSPRSCSDVKQVAQNDCVFPDFLAAAVSGEP